MPIQMKITPTFNKTIDGHDLVWHLTTGLEAAIANSAAAATLLTPILASNKFEVVIKEKDVATATSGQRVTINATDVKITTAKTAADLKEFVESTIFELVNAKNFAAFKALDDALKLGTKPLLGAGGYGRAKADFEAEASWTSKEILIQRRTSGEKYAPSKWGEATIAGCSGKANLEAFKTTFRDLPHNKSAPKDTAATLITEQFYAYNGAVIVAGFNNSKILDKILKKFSTKANPNERLSLKKLGQVAMGQSGDGSFAEVTQFHPEVTACFYHVAIEAITTNKDLVVEFQTGARPNWAFTFQMKQVAKDANNALKAKIDAALAQKVGELVGVES